MLIAIAGGDGAGKSTLSHALAQALRARGLDAVRLDRFDILDAARSPASAFIDAEVLSVRQAVLAMPSAEARLLFMLWSMAITAASQLAESRDRVVIYDSYWMKHTAVEIVFGADEAAALAAAKLLPPADLVFYVKVDPETALARKPDDLVAYECGLDPELRPESFLAHQRRIAAHLDAWSKRDGWIEVDGTRPPTALVEQLCQRIVATREALRATA